MSTSASDVFFNQRLAIIISVSFFFGVMMSIVKGNEADIRGAIGNICALWLLLPFITSVLAKKYGIIQGAIVGFITSFFALIGFYFANSFVLSLGSHPWLVKVSMTIRSGWFYYMLCILSGPFFGALGGWYVRYKTTILPLLMAFLFVLEPFTWKLYDWGGFRSYPIISVVEVAMGIIAFLALVIRFKLSFVRDKI